MRRARERDAGAYLCLAVGCVLCVHARVEGDTVEAGGLGEGGEGAGETGEGDELVVAKGSHGRWRDEREREVLIADEIPASAFSYGCADPSEICWIYYISVPVRRLFLA